MNNCFARHWRTNGIDVFLQVPELDYTLGIATAGQRRWGGYHWQVVAIDPSEIGSFEILDAGAVKTVEEARQEIERVMWSLLTAHQQLDMLAS